ncbi:hypothetical protein V3851_09130 [Paenibacillus sp. M1]|uniref:Amidase n=1 Tax=Paenibacillus haidiansis TaxID=1574488 RepID=A0ABU7VQE8_9BACL
MKTGTHLRQSLVLIACLITFSLFGSLAVHAQDNGTTYPDSVRSTWLWHTQLIQTQPDELLDFSASQGIDIIYLQISTKVGLDSYKSFISEASAKGIEVHALNGAPDWALSYGKPKLESFIKWVADYQGTAAPAEQFHGIQVDIEPYLLPEWKSDMNGTVRQWQENVEFLKGLAEPLDLPLSAALPFWLDNYKVPEGDQTLSTWMISRFDSVTLMSYRDNAAAIYNAAKSELLDGERLGKKVHTGVETKPSSEGDFITFYEEGSEVLNEQLAQLEQLASAHSSFGGIAVHDLVGWMDLVKRGDSL